jgi:hypothetical protein
MVRLRMAYQRLGAFLLLDSKSCRRCDENDLYFVWRRECRATGGHQSRADLSSSRWVSNNPEYRIQVVLTNKHSLELPEPRPEPLSTVPFPHDPEFVSRHAILDQIHEKASIPGSRIALVGLGGVG